MRRRDVLAALPMALAVAGIAKAQTLDVEALVRRRAHELSTGPYRPPSKVLPRALAELDYDGYRELRFRPEMAVWGDLDLPFRLQMFHRGGLFRSPVQLFEVVDDEVREIAYRPELFAGGQAAFPPDLGFAGFRIHAPLNDPERFDEFAVFLGASYFRAAPRGGVYGLSARGIELGAGEPGEEFPAFRSFFIERPAPGAETITVHALLDGPSVAGAYRFVIRPGEPTLFEVSASLFPRRRLSAVGIAPLTSMFLFGTEQPRRFDDFRPEVHDSDGLLVDDGQGRRIWRPLSNPARVQASPFRAEPPRGYGLLQRQRALETYQDLEAHYHRRPGAWVEPLSDWGGGEVRLVELPSRTEGVDNIVTSWRPDQPLEAHREHRFRYRLNWSSQPEPDGPARSILWREGQGDAARRRRFIVEFAPLDAASIGGLKADVTASAGVILHPVVQANPSVGGARLSFEFEPQGVKSGEIRAQLFRTGQPVSELWIHRWGG